jgi:hypothetical protein
MWRCIACWTSVRCLHIVGPDAQPEDTALPTEQTETEADRDHDGSSVSNDDAQVTDHVNGEQGMIWKSLQGKDVLWKLEWVVRC